MSQKALLQTGALALFGERGDATPAALSTWDMPALIPELCGRTDATRRWRSRHGGDPGPGDLVIFGSRGLRLPARATLAFYREDDGFERVWRDPGKYVALFRASGYASIIEPDFSLWTNDPLPVRLFNAWRNRHLGRLFQEAGFEVVPNLTWSARADLAFTLEGIPHGTDTVAVEWRPGLNTHLWRAFIDNLGAIVERIEPRRVLAYTHPKWAALIAGALSCDVIGIEPGKNEGGPSDGRTRSEGATGDRAEGDADTAQE